MAEKWHFFPFSHPWASLCQTLPDASSVSVSSPEPRVSPASPQVHPTWVVWEALLGVHVDDVAGNPVLDHRPCHSLRTAGRESFFTLFHSSSCVCVPDPISPVTSFVTLLQHMQLWGYASRNHHKLCPKFPSLVFFFFFLIKLWALLGFCTHPELAVTEVTYSLFFTMKRFRAHSITREAF